MSLPLKAHLDAITKRTRELVQPERLAITEQSIAQQRIMRSDDLLAIGPLIIKFFRGRWCPYCITELEAWRDCYEAVRARGALLIAISPQTARQSDFTVQQHALQFPLLRDEQSVLAEEFGIAYTVPPTQQRHYRSMLVNIPFINGETTWRLPLATTFVVDQSGLILYSKSSADFRERPEPEEVIAVLP